MCRECVTATDVGSFEPLHGKSCSPQVPLHFRLEERLYGVVVCGVALPLEVDKEVGEAPYLLREVPEQALLAARLPGPTV